MKRISITSVLFSMLMVFFVSFTGLTQTQENNEPKRHKAVFLEIGGSGATWFTANFDMRLNKGRNDGLGMRFGVGGGTLTEDPFLIDNGSVKTKMLTVPVEVNYILGQRRFAFEIGLALTYVSISEDTNYVFLGNQVDEHESEDLVVAYLPVGFRLNPKKNGFMLKLNLGPIWNFAAPNLYSENSINIFGGLAVGYSFY